MSDNDKMKITSPVWMKWELSKRYSLTKSNSPSLTVDQEYIVLFIIHLSCISK